MAWLVREVADKESFCYDLPAKIKKASISRQILFILCDPDFSLYCSIQAPLVEINK